MASERQIVQRYLVALRDATSPERREREMQRLQARLDSVEAKLHASPTTLRRVELIQLRMDTQHAITNLLNAAVDLEALEAAFIEVGASWAQREGVTRAALEAAGIPADVLDAAMVP